jgi:hypothetical protein
VARQAKQPAATCFCFPARFGRFSLEIELDSKFFATHV